MGEVVNMRNSLATDGEKGRISVSFPGMRLWRARGCAAGLAQGKRKVCESRTGCHEKDGCGDNVCLHT